MCASTPCGYRVTAPIFFETRMGFANRDQSVSGTFVNVWQRGDRGRLVRTREGRLFISGSRSRLALQLHANLVDFARRTERVDRVEVEAREVGRYAYRFMHGPEVDAATRAEIGRRLAEASPLLGVEIDSELFASLRSPREIVDFVVLPRIREPWMEVVNEIVQSQGFRFTVDQVVDVARRPGLTFLLDQPAYCMSLEVTDDRTYAQLSGIRAPGAPARVTAAAAGCARQSLQPAPQAGAQRPAHLPSLSLSAAQGDA